MRFFLFKLLFKLAWWIFPSKKSADEAVAIYISLLEREKALEICKQRERELDAAVRPRTYTKKKGTCTHTDFFDRDGEK